MASHLTVIQRPFRTGSHSFIISYLLLHICSIHSTYTGLLSQSFCISCCSPWNVLGAWLNFICLMRSSVSTPFKFIDLLQPRAYPTISCDLFLLKILITNCHNILLFFIVSFHQNINSMQPGLFLFCFVYCGAPYIYNTVH